MNNSIYILRIWHTFNPEKLQNMDGKKGNDILPLPNTKKLPYIDTLINDSTIASEIFIYSGKKLSQNQKQQYENLHEIAKSKGGHLYVIDGDECFKEETKVKMATGYIDSWLVHDPEIKKFDFYLDYFDSPHELDKNYRKALFVDFQRAVYLNHLSKISDIIQEKYQDCNINFDKILYLDFDSSADVVKKITQINTKELSDTILPLNLDVLDEDEYKVDNRFISPERFKAELEHFDSGLNYQQTFLQIPSAKKLNQITVHNIDDRIYMSLRLEYNSILHSKDKILSENLSKLGMPVIDAYRNFFQNIFSEVNDIENTDLLLHCSLEQISYADGYFIMKSGASDPDKLSFSVKTESYPDAVKAIEKFAILNFEYSKDLTWQKDIEQEVLTAINKVDVQQHQSEFSASRGQA